MCLEGVYMSGRGIYVWKGDRVSEGLFRLIPSRDF